jgi:hypothetical protein
MCQSDHPLVDKRNDEPRLTEVDIAKRKLGEQGNPGKPPKPPVANERKLQISDDLDRGHTA